MMLFSEEIKILDPLVESLKQTKDLGEKQEILLSQKRVALAIASGNLNPYIRLSEDLSSKNALFALSAIGQENILLVEKRDLFTREKMRKFLNSLTAVDRFYESIGGIVGYQLKILKFLENKKREEGLSHFSPAKSIDIRRTTPRVNEIVIEGIKALAEMGELYPIGGLGSRLNLKNKTGKDLPAALLPFAGKTLLEGLIRDLQAREFCYFRLFGKQITVPIAIMTSKENENDLCIQEVCSKKKWFQRPKEAFFLFTQISVPVVTKEGNWCLKAPLEPYLQPGGHGALWRTAEEKGVFSWFLEQDKSYLLIRQINNPIAGVDHGLSALMGCGKKENKTFGFASCERLENAAEGALAIVEEEDTIRLSNIEYTEFQKFGLEKRLKAEPFLANTNILYVDLRKLFSQIKKAPLPGLVLNMKSKISYVATDGTQKEEIGGRLESMMQNISDSLLSQKKDSLATFLTYNERRKTISVTKKSFKGDLLETPEGAFYDLLKNGHELLEKCLVKVAPFSSPQEYLEMGPSLLFLYHPALGPFYEIILQKIKGGKWEKHAELQLEIADLFLENLELEGSLLIEAKNLLGHASQGIVRYSQNTGKCILRNVSVKNKGMDLYPNNLKNWNFGCAKTSGLINRKRPHISNIGSFTIDQAREFSRQPKSNSSGCLGIKHSSIWKNQIKRKEALKIILKGHSEFYAENVTFMGGETILVPEGERWIARQDLSGRIFFEKEKADWQFSYTLQNHSIKVEVPVLEKPSHKLF